MHTNRMIYWGLIVSILGLVAMTGRLFWGGIGFVGTTGLVLFVAGSTLLTTYLLYRVFFLYQKKITMWLLGLLMTVVSMGIMLALPIIFWKLNGIATLSVLSLYTLLLFVIAIVARSSHQAPHPIERSHIPGWHATDIVASHRLWFVLYGAVWLFGMLMLHGQASTELLLSPWQALPMGYLGAVAICGLMLVCLLFSRNRASWILGIIILQSVLMHVYIPAAHVLPAGGDIWRHIGRVELITSGTPILPGLIGDTAMFETVGPAVLPSVLLQPQQYAYSAQWGLMSAWQQLTGLDLLGVSKWGVPLLWAVLMPILFFYIGHLLFRSSRHALMISSATLVPFSMLALGSLSLPVTIGYLAFFFAFLLLLIAMRYGTRMQWGLVVMSALGLLFIYPLHALIYVVLATIGGILYRLRDKVYTQKRRIITMVCAILAIGILPLVELAAGMSELTNINIIETLKRIVGEHSGWYIAMQIRPHDILSGNILWNHLPSFAYVETLFTHFRWPLIMLSIGIYLSSTYGYIMALVKEKRTTWQLLVVLASMVWGGYGISWYLLGGEHQLARRLDVLFAALLLLFGWYGLTYAIDQLVHTKRMRMRVTVTLLFISFGMWWGSMSAFTLGPDMRYLSTYEYRTGQYITEQLSGSNCVLADTWPLLAVEALTAGSSIGGGFPMTEQYGQREREQLYISASSNPSSTIWADIARVHIDDTCIIAIPITDPIQIRSYEAAFGTSTLVGSFAVWQEELPRGE